MQAINFEETLERILQSDSRYHRNAYLFLREGLDHTHKKLGKDGKDVIQHVTGQELLAGLREYALQQFGPMAMMVLDEWGVRRCEDWGEIVFIMIEHSLLAKTDTDSREDFAGGYDFFEALRQPFCVSSSKIAQDLLEPKPQA
ncbi:MAG TPA: Minf_1886 family protein [Candidatus Binatia bacterium]|nr:Minf_1886 family protein [Candidatus Binatia bacterium]